MWPADCGMTPPSRKPLTCGCTFAELCDLRRFSAWSRSGFERHARGRADRAVRARTRPETPPGRAALTPSRGPDRGRRIGTSAPAPRHRCEDVRPARAVVPRARPHLPRRRGCRAPCNTPQQRRAGRRADRCGSPAGAARRRGTARALRSPPRPPYALRPSSRCSTARPARARKMTGVLLSRRARSNARS